MPAQRGVSQEVCESAWRGNSRDVRVVYHLSGKSIGRGFFLSEKCYRHQILNFPFCDYRHSSYWFRNEGSSVAITSVGYSEWERSEKFRGFQNGSALWSSLTRNTFVKMCFYEELCCTWCCVCSCQWDLLTCSILSANIKNTDTGKQGRYQDSQCKHVSVML